MCLSSQYISCSASHDTVTAMWPMVSMMGQWPPLDKHNVHMYSCYGDVQQNLASDATGIEHIFTVKQHEKM